MIYAIFQQEKKKIEKQGVVVKMIYDPNIFKDVAYNLSYTSTTILGFYANKNEVNLPVSLMDFFGHTDHLIGLNCALGELNASVLLCTLWHELAHFYQMQCKVKPSEFCAQYYMLRKAYQLSKKIKNNDLLIHAIKNTKNWLSLEDNVYVNAAQELMKTRLWRRAVYGILH